MLALVVFGLVSTICRQFVLNRKPIAVRRVLLATVCLVPSDNLFAWI
jgi:hypothetical protein